MAPDKAAFFQPPLLPVGVLVPFNEGGLGGMGGLVLLGSF